MGLSPTSRLLYSYISRRHRSGRRLHRLHQLREHGGSSEPGPVRRDRGSQGLRRRKRPAGAAVRQRSGPCDGGELHPGTRGGRAVVARVFRNGAARSGTVRPVELVGRHRHPVRVRCSVSRGCGLSGGHPLASPASGCIQSRVQANRRRLHSTWTHHHAVRSLPPGWSPPPSS